MAKILNFLFHTQTAREHPWLERGWLAMVYGLGLWLWGRFFSWGKFPLDFHDWAEISAARLAYLRDAALHGLLPLHASEMAHLRNVTDRLMSIPDVVLSPQVLLMRWMDVGAFVLVNTLLLYSLSFWGLLWFRKRYALSPLIFAVLVFLFNFNGHLISHFTIGHVTWWGYFLFPLFFIQLFRLLEDNDHSWRWVGQTAGVLFLIFLQGGFHHFIWCLMFLGMLALVAWQHFWPILKTLIAANLLSMVRLLPPALLLGKFDTDFYGGYRLPQHILSALLIERLPQNAMPFENFNSNLGYWEFDLYIGATGVVMVAFGLILWLLNQKKKRQFPVLLAPMLVMTVLAVRDFYKPFTFLPIPLLSAERVTARLVILPLSLAFILALVAIQAWLERSKRPLWVYGAGLVLCGYLLFDLGRHAMRWQIAQAFQYFPATPVNLAIKVLANHPDPPYFTMLATGAAISLLSGVVMIYLARRERENH
jgi:hypothetical protein